jgi:hypothetical protein
MLHSDTVRDTLLTRGTLSGAMAGDSGVPMTPTYPKKENIQRVDPSVKNPYTPKERKYLAARKIQRKKISSGLTQ